jgi:hypothetical protein
MNRHLWLLVTGCGWAVMMYFLFDREIRPYFEYQQPPTYRTRLQTVRQPEVERRTMLFADRKIGETESLVEPLPQGGHLMRSRVLMNVKAFYPNLKLPDDRAYLASEVRVDAAFQMAEFRMDARLQGIPVQIRGDRQGDRLRVAYNLILFKGDRLVEFPRDATLSDSFLPYQGGARLTEGKKWKMKVVDLNNLISMNRQEQLAFTERYATVEGREVVPLDGGERPAWKVVVRELPTDEGEKWMYQLWIDDGGTVVKQAMKYEKLVCEILLQEKRSLSAEEAQGYRWNVQPPR